MKYPDIDFSKTVHLTMPSKRGHEMAISVTKARDIVLNGRLLEEIRKTSPEAYVSFDYTQDERAVIITDAGEKNDFRFGKTGRVKHRQFAGELEKLGYAIPAKYHVEWDSEKDAWIGILQEVCNAPTLKSSSSNKRKVRKK